MENDLVARMHAQIGRFVAGCIGVAIANSGVFIRSVIRGEPHFQNTVLAAQIFWFLDHAPEFRARAIALGPYKPVREA
jgi:hypothetical protein